ncbi:Bacillithiol biosynthesis thiol disulfide oxidoreductase, YpdA [Gemmatirosa kalamazoonensis]|uniref:Bacillithiol biosynthesis thiol disulfide oxidoreductase, YpdA n=1 Tax=Gemmatirosa kalamazoonensis TaxID=861299 RepID=W0RJ46_9BACT|nr:YpdA family putative bacillithiol disulfide reductase [Gemmatirosa kalamazoonensis]AHG90345.1 Bacillithiol biosynthesis thiol disulfide oxidoreductase, YpdA [Gemmatirosa kalamazoonensis]
MDFVDVVVVGAGPCGLAAAISAMRAGMSVAVLDKGPVCSTITHYPTYATFFSTAEKLSIGGLPFILAETKPTRKEALAYYRGVVRHFAIPVRQYETALAIEGKAPQLVVRSRKRSGTERTTRCRAVIVATGYFGTPNRIGVPGEDLPHVTHTYHEAHEAFEQDVVVVGGGNSAAEAALDLYRTGARVTVVHFGPSWDKRIKPWVLPDITNRIHEGSIAACWNSRVAEIRPESVIVQSADGAQELPADHVYLLTGFAPDTSLLASTGVRIDPATGIPAHDPATFETNVRGVYMVGVLVAGYDANQVFIENGRFHGDRIVAHLTGSGRVGEVLVSADPDS